MPQRYRKSLVLLLGGLALLVLGACDPGHSGFQGDISGPRLNTGLIMVPQAGAKLRLTGSVALDSGSATVSLLAPDGSLAWSEAYRKGPASATEFFVAGYSQAASGGTWTVRIQGDDESSSGTYSLSLDLH